VRELQKQTVNELTLFQALTETEINLCADVPSISTHSAQSAFVATALLMARSGHRVFLSAPNVELIGPQPPLKPGGIVDQLVAIGCNLLPSGNFNLGPPKRTVDLIATIGSTVPRGNFKHQLNMNADDWTGVIQAEEKGNGWYGNKWPYGAMAAAGLAATEAFKLAMQKLASTALDRKSFSDLLALTRFVTVSLGKPSTPQVTDLGGFDIISAGAITNGLLYVLSRIVDVTGSARIFDDDTAEVSNLNRYMLLLVSHLQMQKVDHLASLQLGRLNIEPIPNRFSTASAAATPLKKHVLVGADDIPTRWAAQLSWPDWLGIGATSHWSAMASFHERGLGCAPCLHPTDDPNDVEIPTIAFVSFWAGLLLASYFVRHLSGEKILHSEQQTYLTAPRPERIWRCPVPTRKRCPTCASLGEQPLARTGALH
jgi:hypothetical protein